MDAPDFFQRDFDCNNLHWVAYWLNVLLMHGFITVRHLFVQLVIAMVCYLLMMRVSDWASFPALSTFASVMMYISKGKVYNFCRGKCMYGTGYRDREQKVEIISVELMPPNDISEADKATVVVSKESWLSKVLQPGVILDISHGDGVLWDAQLEVQDLQVPTTDGKSKYQTLQPGPHGYSPIHTRPCTCKNGYACSCKLLL